MNARKDFRDQVEEALKRRGWRLKDLANEMETTLGYVSRVWGEDEDKISLTTVEKFCDALDVDPVTIDLYVEKMLPTLAREHTSLTSIGRDVLMASRGKRRGKRKIA